MDADYLFGLVVSRSTDAVVRFKPTNPVPIDNMVVLTDSTFTFSSIVGGGTFDLNALKITEPPLGGGIVLDGSKGPIVFNRIHANAVLLCAKGIYLTTGKTKNSISQNWVTVLHNHQCNTHLQIGDAGTPLHRVALNRFDMSIHSEGIAGSVGAAIFGQRNILTLDIILTAPDKNIVFGPEAADNIIHALNLPQGITNNARTPTNRIIPAEPVGFALDTPPVPPSDKALTNLHPYPVNVIITAAGNVTAWTLTDAKGVFQRIPAPLTAGQTITLQPGEKIILSYTTPPTWRWKAAG
jgi:hypothetical protein